MFKNFIELNPGEACPGLRIGKKQPLYLTFIKAGRASRYKLARHRIIGEKPFLGRWYWGFWIPRVRISLTKKYITKLKLQWLIFSFDVDKY